MTNNPHRRTWISFAIFALFLVAVAASWKWASHVGEDDDISPVFRSALEANGRLWQGLSRLDKKAPEFAARPKGQKARLNGDLGLSAPLDLAAWQLEVVPDADHPGQTPLKLSMEDLRALPRTQSTLEFKCIEGWSEINTYTGVRFSDFLKHYGLGQHPPGSGGPDRFLYVGLETPDGEYYVSIDMQSMLQPQTLLAYEINGLPLTADHGAPLRLIIPVKYGIKNIKRIGKIFFSDQRPPDYWAERGYDWFSGL